MLNLSDTIKNKLSVKIQDILKSVRENKNGFNIYLVGGVVRDLILGREIFDIDITVEGDAVELCRMLEKNNIGKIKQIQNDLRTAKMVFEDGIEIDFASTRKEFYPKKGCMPEILEIGCPLSEDVKRRDFTINSLILSLNEANYGAVIDFVGGLEDIEAKKLRILHDLSFIDDPTRILRGLKFSVRFGFELEEKTKNLQDDYLKNHLSTDICYSRVKSELIQTFSLNIALAYDFFVEQEIYRLLNLSFNKFVSSLKIKEAADKYQPEYIWLLYVGVVLTGSKVLNLLELTKNEKKIVTHVQKMLKSTAPVDNFEVYKFFESMPVESVLVYYFITQNSQALHFLDDFKDIKLNISGEDLIKLGMKPSEEFKSILDSVLEEKLSGNLFSKDDELKFLRFQIKQLKK